MQTTNFEHILLKKLTHNGEFFGKIMPLVQPQHFQSVGNKELFRLIKEYYNDHQAIPTLTELIVKVKNVANSEMRQLIVDELQGISKTDEVANMEFMLEETVSFVKDSMYLEALQLGSDGLLKKDDALKLKASQIMDERAKISIDSDLGLDFDDIDEMIKYYQERLLGIRTQHKEFNKRLGAGFLPQTLSIILAASGVGKSLLMTDLISGQIKEGKNVLLVSMEMADREIMKRVHANALDLPINHLGDLSKTDGQLAELQKERPVINKDQIIQKYNTLKMSGKCGKFYVKDYPNGAFSALMLENLVQGYKIEKDVEFDIIYLDYLGIMKSDLISPSAGLYSYVKSIAEEVRATARKLKIPIVSASQLNRSAVNDVEASNDSVSDSIGTVQTADFMVFLLQNEMMKEEKIIKCKVTKNRFTGRTDSWDMSIDYEHMRFHDMLVQDGSSLMTDTEAESLIGEDKIANLNIIKAENKKNGVEADFGIGPKSEIENILEGLI